MSEPETARVVGDGLPAWHLAVLYVAFAALALAVYGPSLRGDFLSDDIGYLVTNPWVHELTASNLRVLLDPFGEAARYTANYAPVHLVGVALVWQAFGADTVGHHVVNVLAHALASVLLVPLFVRAGLSRRVALFGALFFLLHPANVEVGAWIFQLKTILCLALGTGAVLLHPRRPAAAAVLFVLALLAKASAVFALPAAAFFAWRRSRLADPVPARWGWLALWVLAFALYASPQIFAFEQLGEAPRALGADAFESLRTVFAIFARYAVMAATSYGTAAFQSPPPARSLLDPWWLAGLTLALVVTLRLAWTAFRRREEAGFWLWVAAAYAPVCQIFPFLYPMADRYLYVVLPGLVGAVCLAAKTGLASRAGALAGGRRAALDRVGFALACVLLAAFAVRSHERAAVFRSSTTLMLDSARRYPAGLSANLLQAQRAGQSGDAAAVAEALRRASDLGFDSFFAVETEPSMQGVRNDPRVRAAVAEMAARWIEVARRRGYSTPRELQIWARAHAVRGEWKEAAALLERALAQGGPLQAEVQRALAEARRHLTAAGGAPPR
ncbi:MAG: hypothetical protein IT386_05830 [Deltaproteobacteria bacterium]|nr:hypothetical protein [Deltaproteobacteria bacterium]